MKIRVALVLLAPTLFCGPPAQAQNAPDGRWHYLVQPYIMFPNMKGETGVRELPLISIDESPSDIFENLQMGAMFYAEAQNDRWTFSTDTLYMNLGSDMSRNEPGLIEDISVDVSQIGWELAAMRRLTPRYELGLGLTYNQIDVDMEIAVGLPGPPSQISGAAGREVGGVSMILASPRLRMMSAGAFPSKTIASGIRRCACCVR